MTEMIMYNTNSIIRENYFTLLQKRLVRYMQLFSPQLIKFNRILTFLITCKNILKSWRNVKTQKLILLYFLWLITKFSINLKTYLNLEKKFG